MDIYVFTYGIINFLIYWSRWIANTTGSGGRGFKFLDRVRGSSQAICFALVALLLFYLGFLLLLLSLLLYFLLSLANGSCA